MTSFAESKARYLSQRSLFLACAALLGFANSRCGGDESCDGASGWQCVGNTGGVVELAGEGVSVRIPAGALEGNTPIRIRALDDPAQTLTAALPADRRYLGKAYVFEPHNPNLFRAEVNVCLPCQGARADLTVLRLDDPSDTSFEVYRDQVQCDGAQLCFSTSGFSVYALAAPSSIDPSAFPAGALIACRGPSDPAVDPPLSAANVTCAPNGTAPALYRNRFLHLDATQSSANFTLVRQSDEQSVDTLSGQFFATLLGVTSNNTNSNAHRLSFVPTGSTQAFLSIRDIALAACDRSFVLFSNMGRSCLALFDDDFSAPPAGATRVALANLHPNTGALTLQAPGLLTDPLTLAVGQYSSVIAPAPAPRSEVAIRVELADGRVYQCNGVAGFATDENVTYVFGSSTGANVEIYRLSTAASGDLIRAECTPQ